MFFGYYGPSGTPVPTKVSSCFVVADNPEPPLCKGRWHAKRDGGIVVGTGVPTVRDINQTTDTKNFMVALGLNQNLFQGFWRVQRTFFQKGSLAVPRSPFPYSFSSIRPDKAAVDNCEKYTRQMPVSGSL